MYSYLNFADKSFTLGKFYPGLPGYSLVKAELYFIFWL